MVRTWFRPTSFIELRYIIKDSKVSVGGLRVVWSSGDEVDWKALKEVIWL